MTRRDSTSATGAGGDDENPFQLIERGNAMASSGNLWSASDAFGKASVALRHQAGTVVYQLEKAKDVGSSDAFTKNWHEQRKIAELYLDQSREYLYRGRGCLLNALKSENDQDRERMNLSTSNQGPVGRALLRDELEPLVIIISSEEKERRLRIFKRLFAMPKKEETEEGAGTKHAAPDDEIGPTKKETNIKPPDSDAVPDAKPPAEIRSEEENEPDAAEKDTGEGAKEQLDAKTEVLEKRLSAFESTLPERCKSERERISDIHKRMKKMGFSVPDEERNRKKGFFDFDDAPKSEEEQIRRIMEQAKDEVKLAGDENGGAPGEDGDGAESGDDDDEALIINDADDLNDILRKAGMAAVGDDSVVEANSTAVEVVKTAERDATSTTTNDVTKMLNLIETAQGLLFEASAYLEDAAAAASDDDDSESDRKDDDEEEDDKDDLGGSKGETSARTEGIRRGKASLVKAQKCIEAVVVKLPPSGS